MEISTSKVLVELPEEVTRLVDMTRDYFPHDVRNQLLELLTGSSIPQESGSPDKYETLTLPDEAFRHLFQDIVLHADGSLDDIESAVMKEDSQTLEEYIPPIKRPEVMQLAHDSQEKMIQLWTALKINDDAAVSEVQYVGNGLAICELTTYKD